jgi:NAD-dependent SIR2 family protein deacetylase
MGVDSGLPDFRGPEGFWRAYPAIARRGLRFEQMAQPVWFHRAPELAWAFYGHRLNLYRTTAPHAGFRQLLELSRSKPGRCFVFTSNVDGQFQQAGFPAECIAECHGSLHHLQCCQPCGDAIWPADGEVVTVDEEAFLARPPLPACRHCGGLARPNVLMFGDGAWISQRSDAQETALRIWLAGLQREGRKAVIIELGAGTAVPTVRCFSERWARMLGATLVRINPREPAVPRDGIGLALGAAEGIRRLCAG